jgi:hypothetical protein
VSATLCYGDFGLRTFSDIDLLVEPAEVAAASELLESRGYASQFKLSSAWQARLVRLGTEHLFRHADGLEARRARARRSPLVRPHSA